MFTVLYIIAGILIMLLLSGKFFEDGKAPYKCWKPVKFSALKEGDKIRIKSRYYEGEGILTSFSKNTNNLCIRLKNGFINNCILTDDTQVEVLK